MAVKKIHREDILKASVTVMETQGYERLSVRNIAAELHSSTQPIYSEFHNINHLKEELLHYISEHYLKTSQSSYKAFALLFLRFAKNHRELFKFFYLRNRGEVPELEDINRMDVVCLLAEALQLPSEKAWQLHHEMQTYCYALGVMLASGYREMSERQIDEELIRIFRIVLCYYKGIRSQVEYDYWLNRTHHLYQDKEE